MAKVSIDLMRSDVDCLSSKVADDSPLAVLFGAPNLIVFVDVRPPGEANAAIECTDDQAKALLEIALQYCPDAVYPIKEALRRVG